MYFLGRADARGEDALVADRIRKLLAGMTGAQFQNEEQECAAILAARGRALTEFGKKLRR
jgi:hypothetical protein